MFSSIFHFIDEMQLPEINVSRENIFEEFKRAEKVRQKSFSLRTSSPFFVGIFVTAADNCRGSSNSIADDI